MTARSPVVRPISQIQLAPGSVATIPHVSWQEFESILQEMGEKRAARMVYSQGTLEIGVPLPEPTVYTHPEIDLEILHLAPLRPPSPEGAPCPPQVWGELESQSPHQIKSVASSGFPLSKGDGRGINRGI